jgi:hypothetical protein
MRARCCYGNVALSALKSVYDRIKITKKSILWQNRLFASKNILKFAYGFAVPIDWETHQLLSKTELSSYEYVQWRAAPSGSF